jgi:hypothetical protein
MRGGLREEDKAAGLHHARAAIEAGADDAATLATAGFCIGLIAILLQPRLALAHANAPKIATNTARLTINCRMT